MKLKTAIRLVRYSNFLVLLAVIPIIWGILSWVRNGRIIALEVCIIGACLILFLARRYTIAYVLQNSQYPDVLYAVLNKMRLIIKMDLSLFNDMLFKVYRPPYSTERFLEDNNLRANLGFVPRSNDYQLKFTEEGLCYWDQFLPWQDIYDWKYTVPAGSSQEHMIIYYHTEKWNGLEKAIPVNSVDSNYVDMMLLLAYFKGRYGGASSHH